MRNSVASYAYDISTNVIKRESQTPAQISRVSRNVAIGIIITVIALTICTVIALFMWHLTRQRRMEDQEQPVDLLAEESFSTVESGDIEKGLSQARYDEKPLPRLPSGISVYESPEGRGIRNSSVSVIRFPAPVLHSEKNIMPSTSDGLSRPHSRLSTRSPSNTRTAATLDQNLSRSRNESDLPGPTRDTASVASRGHLAVINVTDADVPPAQEAQSVSEKLPGYKNRVRGRDPPFPSRTDRNMDPGDPGMEPGDHDEASTAPAYPSEKSRVLDVPVTPDPPSPGSSYMIHLPPSVSTSRSTLAPPRPRQPLTITASRPVSNIIVEDMRTIPRPSGLQGKGRVVTMSVLLEESDTSNYSEADPTENLRTPRTRDSIASSDVLGQVVARYEMRDGDLPPYTPRETTRAP